MHEVFENLNTLLDGDIEAIKEISSDFTTQMHIDMPTVIGHINNGNYSEGRKIAHKLKGSVMNFNMPLMLEAFISLENSLDSENQDASFKYCNKILLALSTFDTLLSNI